MKDEQPTLRSSDLTGFQAHIAVLERQLGERDARIRTLEAVIHTDAERIANKDARIRELEQQLHEYVHYITPGAQTQVEQQLKTAQERLAEAERLMRQFIRLYDEERLHKTGSTYEAMKEYFSKHSKERGNA